MTLVAIHQPNFFPWLGYFDKIKRADIFVFLDSVDYPRSGSGGMGSWCNRVKIDLHRNARWVTCPLKRAPLGTAINAIKIDDAQPWRKKLIKSLRASYARAPNFHNAMEALEPMILRDCDDLAAYNMANISEIADLLGLKTNFVKLSEIDAPGRSTERLVNIVKGVNGDAYLSGGGAGGYQQTELFASSGLELVMQNYAPQNDNASDIDRTGLSVIDHLFHGPINRAGWQ